MGLSVFHVRTSCANSEHTIVDAIAGLRCMPSSTVMRPDFDLQVQAKSAHQSSSRVLDDARMYKKHGTYL